MTRDRARVENIKDNAPMELVVELLGGEIGEGNRKWTSIHCPFHEDEVASAGISPDGMYFHCMACGSKGDVIALVMIGKKTTFLEALKWLEANVTQRSSTTDSW